MPWPLDPALVRTRDETTLARMLYSTPLRVDPRSGDIAPGLCTTWQALHGGRVWRFRCTHADAIAKQLLRVAHTPASPGRWMFAQATHISSAGDVVYVRLRSPWLRFPYALTAATAAPRVPGPFRVVRARAGEIVARRGALTVRIVQLPPHRAAVLFRRGLLDEAPVPLGDIRAALADGTIRRAVHVQPLLAVDALIFDLSRGSLARRPITRRVYWRTANRADYEGLVAESQTGAAASFVAGAGQQRTPASAYRVAKSQISTLPHLRVNIAVQDEPVLRYGASLLIASWRDLGLGARTATAGQQADARFVRVAAPYPQEEALLAQLAPQPEVLGALNQSAALARADEALFARTAVVPVAWALDARLVSPRVHGWSEDRLGDVDYSGVRLNPRG